MARVLSIYKDGQLDAIKVNFGYWKHNSKNKAVRDLNPDRKVDTD